MSMPVSESAPLTAGHSPWQLALGARLGLVAVALTLETLALSFLIQQTPVTSAVGLAAVVHDIQHWLFRFLIAYAAACALLFSLGHRGSLASIGSSHRDAPIRLGWLAAHALTLIPFALLSSQLYSASPRVPFMALAIGWHLNAAIALITLFAALAPLPVWARAFDRSRAVLLYAIAPALGTVLAIQWSQSLWRPAAGLTFWMTTGLLHPFLPNLVVDVPTLTVGTNRFAVTIADVCSGLEGVGLMLVFCASWLWFFRREYYFPRAFLIIPGAMILIFLLNTVRIAALVLLGDAGFARIAVVGFHSQAGWIAFNLAAFVVAITVKRSAWLNRTAAQTTRAASHYNPTAPYLMPLLAILSTGMLTHAMSAGFDYLYPVRLIAAAAVLWVYRSQYRELLWGFSWRGAAAGIAVFVVWAGVAHFGTAPQSMPDALELASAPVRAAWIGARALAAILTVPIAEELAYRGFLMRRIATAEFESLRFSAVRWPALVISSIIFGITHGSFWLPGMLAGFAFGLVAIRTDRIGEAVFAHAIANVCIVADVLLFDQWQLW
jgi:exosortase E/protease (VPEID-CTERM system)